MKYSEQKCVLALALCQGLGVKTVLALLKKLSLNELFTLGKPELCALGLSEQVANNLLHTDWSKIDSISTFCQNQQIHILTIFSSAYPTQLKEICNPPIVLFL